MKKGEFIILCRKDCEKTKGGDYELATRQTFTSLQKLRTHMKGINPSRKPVVAKLVYSQ